MLKNRAERLLPFFENNRLDLLLVTGRGNLRYLTGFSGSEGAALLTREGGWFICDSRYSSQAAREVSGLELVEHSRRVTAVAELVRRSGADRVGFEAGQTTVLTHRELSDAIAGVELVGLDTGFDTIRSCKDQDELLLLEKVARLASDSFEAVLPELRPGISEEQFALLLEFEIRSRGAEGRSFDFIVASGERGALPHGRASGKKIQAGELVTVDFGAMLDGYCSDETVTVAVGTISERQQEIYRTVLEAHDRGVAAIRPGASCRAVDGLVRDFIREKGFGDYFGHGLGHGVGLEIHEKPQLSPRSEATLEEGMVVTVEPGIYIPGFGGVRIEDTVVVTADGCRLITAVPKKLRIV